MRSHRLADLATALGNATRLARFFILALAIVSALPINMPLAQVTTVETGQPAPPPQKVQYMLQLLDDKDVQDWLAAQMQAKGAAVAEQTPDAGMADEMSGRLDQIRQHLRTIALAVPQLPGEIGHGVERLRVATEGYGFLAIILLACSFILLGFGAEWLFKYFSRGLRATASSATPATTPGARAGRLLWRLVYEMGCVAAFITGALGGFLVFQWPHLLRVAVVALLMAALTLMISRGLLTILFGSTIQTGTNGNEERLLPLRAVAARHYRSRILLAIGWFAFGYALVQILRLLSIEAAVVQLVAYALGLALLVIGLGTIWRRPNEKAAEPESADAHRSRSTALSWLYSLSFVALWILWVASAMKLFWLLAVVTGLPIAIRWARNSVHHLFRSEEPSAVNAQSSGVKAVAIERVLRLTLIFAAIWVLAWAGDVSINRMAEGETAMARVAGGVLTVIVILLVADLAWQLIRTSIDAFLAKAAELGEPGSKEAIRRAKVRTLLPIVRNVAMVFLVTLALLMALSAIGIEIAPLIASAGVVGVAIGFGAQTVVKDIISGMFYLLDDAFRVGEYIVTGSFKGTVESFSLRSVRLRHHNGPVYTIPFGDLGAVQNLSRDFVVDKFMLTVTYDSDLEKVRKLLKKAGEQLMADEEIADSILEPLKMQRVDNFGDYGVQLKVKMTTKPGGQFMVRKKAFPLIKRLFDENGIEFAFPTVKVAESAGDHKVAAAQQALAVNKALEPAADTR